jgi:hypothetical protein
LSAHIAGEIRSPGVSKKIASWDRNPLRNPLAFPGNTTQICVSGAIIFVAISTWIILRSP